MDGLDFSSLRPVGNEQADAAPTSPAAAPALDTSSLRPASSGIRPQAAPETGDDPMQIVAGLATGIPNALTGTIEAMERGRKMGIAAPGADMIAGFLQPAVQPLIDKFTGQQTAPIETPMSQSLREGLKKTGLDANDYFAEPKTAGERIMRMAGEGAVTSILPGGQAKGWERLAQIAKELFAGTAAGAASQMGVEAAPDDWKGAAGLAAGLVGGIGGATVAEIPQAAGKLAGKGIDYLKPMVARDATDMAPEMAAETTTGKLAAQKLGNIATDPVAAAEAIRTAPEYVPGSKATAFQASGDIGLGSFEKALARNDEKFKAALLDRVDEQNAARVSALTDIESSGDIGAAAQFFRDRMRTLEEHADTLYDRADKAAKGQYDALGDRAAGDVGEQARTAISSKFKGMNSEASALWNSIDPEHNMHVATQPLVTETARIYGAMSPEEKINLAPYEKNIAGIIGSYGDVLPFDRFKDLRSAITTAMRDAKSFATPNAQAYRRLSMLREAVEQAVERSVSQKFEADPGLAEQFVKQARDWYENRTAESETGALAATGTEGGAGAGAPAAAGASGENGAPSRGPAGPARDQGLPQDVARAVPEAPPPAPVVEAPALAPRPAGEPLPPGGAIEAIDPRDIGVDARRFQFKEGGDEKGVTERLQGVERWDPRLAGTALVYRDAGGKNWVADGHQRMGLARRLIENGHPPFKVNAFILDAADGITDADARAIAAVKNIAEGTGTPIDAAKVLRAAKETGVDLPPLPPRSALVRDGEALAELSPEAFGMVINEVIPAAQGAIVGRMVKDHAAQEEALRVLAKLKPDNARQAEMVVRDLLNSGVEQMTRQGGLFGEEAFASSVVLERAKIADQALKLLKQDKKLFGTLVEEAERIEGAGNALNRDANATRLSTDEKAADLLTQLAFRAGPVSTELSRLARALKAGDQTAHAAARDFLGAIRREVESGVDTGDIAGGAGARAAGEEAPPLERDPNTVEMFQSAPPVESPAFKRWFGDSKVVDAEGKPLVVYHATSADFDAFEPGAQGKGMSSGPGVWFSDDPSYTPAGSNVGRPGKPLEGENVIPAYLSLKNPIELDAAARPDELQYFRDKYRNPKWGETGWGFPQLLTPEVIADLKETGFDGIKYTYDFDGAKRTEYVAFEPTQIKSQFNRGTFDPADPRILHQGKPKPWQPGDMLGEFNTERGLEGLPQAVIPGAEVTDANRMQSQASKPLKGGNAPPLRGGLFDEAGREDSASQMSLFQSGAGAPIRDTMADRFAAAGRPPEEAVAAGELVNAFYTTMAERLGKPVDEIVAQHPLPQVRKGGDVGGLQQGKKAPPVRDLYAVHNIKPGGVLNADKIGGMPMPSLAIARIDKGDFDSFGDISLIGSPRLIDPKGGSGAKSYDADVYSPRYPSITRDINEKAFNALNAPIVADIKKFGGETYDGIDLQRLEDRGPLEALDAPGLKLAYLKDKGVDIPVAKKADGSPDWYANREAIATAIRGERRADYEDWADKKLGQMVKRERIFKGFDYNGNRRYREHTIDNVLSDMRGRLKEGETFNYGIGTIRSKHATQFRSIPAIKKASERITGTKKMQELKDEFGDRFFQLIDEMRPFYKFDAKAFGYADDTAAMFGEIAKKGMRALDEGFEDLPADLKTQVGQYLRDLATAPTEYFETKINRNVGLGEFEAALVPTGTAPRVVDALKKAGLRVVEYEKGKENARTDAIRKLDTERPEDNSLLFQSQNEGPRGSIQFGDDGAVISMFKGADASTALHESGHHFLEMFKSMATGPEAPAAIANDWRAAKAWWDKNAADVAKDGGEGVTSADVRKVLRDGTTGDRMKDLAVDRGLHEQWARGLETYLRDGKAPNSALRAIFEQFKNWLSSIYSHADQLGVKMSPEIRRVFDNMLAPESSRGPKMLDEAAAQRFSKATAATREVKDVFGTTPVKQILNRPGATYDYKMSPESVASNLFKAGPEGSAAIKNVLRAGAPKDAIEAAAVLSLKKAATKDGAIDPAKLTAWRQKHAEALREVPELDTRLRDASRASEALADIGARRKEALDMVERSAVGKLLKVQDDADVSAVLGRMLGKDTAVRDMRSLAAEARGDVDAMSGLRRALVEHMVTRMKTPKDALRADTFQKFLGKNSPALQQVLTPEQMNSLRAIASDMKRASKDVRAPGGGSDTAENLAAKGNYGLEHPSIIGQLFRNALASGAVGVAAHLVQGPIMGALSGIASFLGGSVVQAFRQAGIRRVDDLIREAVLHPELMRALLLKAPKRGNAGSAITVRERLGRIAANNLAISAARDGKPETAGD